MNKKILLVASETIPFAKVGDLAEVTGAFAKTLAAKGLEVGVAIPKYGSISPNYQAEMQNVTTGSVNLAWRKLNYGVDVLKRDGITYYFVDNELFFKRNRIYNYEDDAERFAYFSRVVLTMLPSVGFRPDIIHCNDWHTGLLGVYLKEEFYGKDPFYQGIKVVYTLHNLHYQGIYDPSIMEDVIGLPQTLFTKGNLECDGYVNYMKSGMVYADYITTVSPSYAQEITYPYYGEGLDGYIRNHQAKIKGILNGLDKEVYNPQTDPHIRNRYQADNVQFGKQDNKEELYRVLGLPIHRNAPLIAIVSNLEEAKGMDLIIRVIDELLDDDVQLVVVGSGDRKYETFFQQLEKNHPTKVSVISNANQSLTHLVYAAADIFLMPSRYEPCGLNQLIALKYGAIPIVRATGGLKDTVIPFDKYTNIGNGFLFNNFNAHEMLFTIKKALGIYEDSVIWNKLVRNAMLMSRPGSI